MIIKRYNEFNKVNEELNWWQSLLAGATIAASTILPSFGQTKKDGDKRITQKVHSKGAAEALKKSGWQLDKVEVDTLWDVVINSGKDAEICTSKFDYRDNQFFASGEYTLDKEMKDSIQYEINRINNLGGIIVDVLIESSTDKQKPSTNLQKRLKGDGYTPDNKGLSSARCNSIKDYLLELGMSDSIIQKNPLWERGEETIDAKSRYVFIEFAYIVQESTAPEKESDLKLKTTYYLSKTSDTKVRNVENKGHFKVKKHGTVKKLKAKPIKCLGPGGAFN